MARTLRLCTWNIQLGLQLETILQAVRTQADFADLDVLAIQEASLHSDEEDARILSRALGPDYDSHQITAHFLGTYPQANALIWNTSRIRLDKKDTIMLPRVREVKLSRAELTFLCALPQQQRICVIGEGALSDERIRIYAAHLDVLGLQHKHEQFYRILRDVQEHTADLTIVAGDLNTFRIRSRPRWLDLSAAAERAGLLDLTSDIQWTHAVRRMHLHQKLDAIFVKSARPIDYRSWTLDIPGSDHIPVFAEIRFA